jgi:hypothetical protein
MPVMAEHREAPLVAVTAVPGAGGGLAVAAALGIAAARRTAVPGEVIVCEVAAAARRPTLVSSVAARELESRLRGELRASARGAVCWVFLDADDWRAGLDRCLELDASLVVAFVDPPRWRDLIGGGNGNLRGAVVRADVPARRSLAALAAIDLRRGGLAAGLVTRAPGLVATRRAMAGIEPGGPLGARAARLVARLLAVRSGERGQALPLMLGLALLVVVAGLFAALLGSAATGGARLQRAADLAAVSAARSMRDDHNRLFVAPRTPAGVPNPAHLSDAEYRSRARVVAARALRANGMDGVKSDVSFPGRGFAPTRVRVAVGGRIALDHRAATDGRA